MNLFSRNRTPRTGIESAFKIVMRTSKRDDGRDRKQPIKMRKIDQFWYPAEPVGVARDPMLSDAFIVQSAKHFIDENARFLADTKPSSSWPPYPAEKIWVLYGTYIKPGSHLELNLPDDLSSQGQEIATKGRRYQGITEWTRFFDDCVKEINALLETTWDVNPAMRFYESDEFEAIHRARIEKRHRFRICR